jgi:hypothetical protein
MRRHLYIMPLLAAVSAITLLAATTVKTSPNFNDRMSHPTTYVETAPALIPNVAESLWTTNTWLEEITLINTSANPVTVTINDRQAVPMPVIPPAMSLAAGEMYVIRFGARYCPSGVTWVASANNSIVGYIRGKR